MSREQFRSHSPRRGRVLHRKLLLFSFKYSQHHEVYFALINTGTAKFISNFSSFRLIFPLAKPSSDLMADAQHKPPILVQQNSIRVHGTQSSCASIGHHKSPEPWALFVFVCSKETKVTVAGKPSPKAKLDGDKIEGAGAPDAN
jgi:hypothetical protein